MNSISGRMRLLLAAASSALALAACNSISDVKYKPAIPDPAKNVVLHGTVTGLSARPLVLQLSLTTPGATAPTVTQQSFSATSNISASGTPVGPSYIATSNITFSAVPAGSAYAVTVATQPYGRTCVVANGSGTANAEVSNISVTCTRALPTFTVGGTVVGLPAGATGMALKLVTEEGTEVVPIAAGQTSFTFSADSSLLMPQFAYAVSINTSPTTNGTTDNCAIANGTGTIPTTSPANVTNVTITCAFTVGGGANSVGFPLASGTAIAAPGVTLSLNSGSTSIDTVTITGTATSFTFPKTQLSTASAFYTVTITGQPTGQICLLRNGGYGGFNFTTFAFLPSPSPSVNLTSAANVTTIQVACAVTPLLANQLTGTYRLANGRDVLTFFANGTFLFGTHPATGGAAASGVEQGFYGALASGTRALAITADSNGAGGLSSYMADFGSVNLTTFTKTASNISFSKVGAFGGTATGPFTYNVANSTAGKLTGAWATADTQRVFVYDSGTGFHIGLNSNVANLQDVCLTIADPTAATGTYTQNRSATSCTITGGVVDTDPTAAFGALYGLPGGPPFGGGANPAVTYTVTTGATDSLTLQPAGGAVTSWTRSVPN